MVVAPLAVTVASAVKAASGAGTPAPCLAPTDETWGPPFSEVPWAPSFWGGGMTFGFDALDSRSKGQ
jgi:hypothetical protein